MLNMAIIVNLMSVKNMACVANANENLSLLKFNKNSWSNLSLNCAGDCCLKVNLSSKQYKVEHSYPLVLNGNVYLTDNE
jgi:hypothetical protein